MPPLLGHAEDKLGDYRSFVFERSELDPWSRENFCERTSRSALLVRCFIHARALLTLPYSLRWEKSWIKEDFLMVQSTSGIRNGWARW